MKIAMVAGGTGGHIYPALALGSELIKRKNDVFFIGSNNRMEKDLIPSKGYKFVGFDILSTQGNIFQKMLSFCSMAIGYFKAIKILKGTDLIIGFGNYISVPILLAGKHLKIKTAIHEQNSYAGKANKFLDKKVDLVIGCYEENLKQFQNPNTYILGNPQANNALLAKKDEHVLLDMGLDPKKKTVLIFMGSLGSKTINKMLIDFFKMLDGSYQVIYASGKAYYKQIKEMNLENDFLKIFERVDGVSLMKNCDLLVSRAGATTISEICAMGAPAILVPSPYVPNNHQYFNAKALVDKKAAILLEEKDFSAISLKERIDSIINKQDLLDTLHFNSIKLGNKNVINDIIDKLESIC